MLVVWEQLHGDYQHNNTKSEGYLRFGLVSEFAASINIYLLKYIYMLYINVYDWQDLR